MQFTAAWLLKINVLSVTGSPFHVPIKAPVNPEKVKCYGPGLEPKGVREGAPATFTVDTTEAGEAPLEVTYTDKGIGILFALSKCMFFFLYIVGHFLYSLTTFEMIQNPQHLSHARCCFSNELKITQYTNS